MEKLLKTIIGMPCKVGPRRAAGLGAGGMCCGFHMTDLLPLPGGAGCGWRKWLRFCSLGKRWR